MAIYRLEAKIIGRATGGSAPAAAAYRSGETVGMASGRSILSAAAYRSGEPLRDEGRGLAFDYSRKQHVEYAAIMAPDGAPAWVYDRQTLWNAVERREDASKRPWHAQLAREVLVTLPRELSAAQCAALVRGFVQAEFTSQGMVADIALHRPPASDGGEQPHAHILLTMRHLEGGRFTGKGRDWNRRVTRWRPAWQEHVNRALAEAGSEARVDHRSLEVRGIDREPQVKLGISGHARAGHRHHVQRRLAYHQVNHRNLTRVQARALEDDERAPFYQVARAGASGGGQERELARRRKKRLQPEWRQGIDL